MSRKSPNPTMSRRVAPEDLRRGLYVAVLHVIDQETPYFCDEHSSVKEYLLMPTCESRPLKVLDVCLPFVFVEGPLGAVRTLDVRRHRLAQLDPGYARRVIRALRMAKQKQRKQEKK